MANLISDLKAIPRNSLVILGVSSTWFFTTGLILSWKNLYLSLFGGYLLVGILATITIGMGLVLSYIGGHFGALYSEKNIVLLSMLVTAAGYAIFALARTLEWIVVGVFLMTFSHLATPCLNSLYFGEVHHEQRGLASGLRTAVLNLAAFIAPIVSTHFLLAFLGFNGMMRIGLLLAGSNIAIGSAVIGLLVHQSSTKPNRDSPPHQQSLFLDGWQVIRGKTKTLQLLLIVTVLEVIAYSISSTFEIFMITEVVGVSIELYSILLLIYGLCFIPLGLIFGRYADRGDRWRCALGFLLLPFVNFGLIFARGFWQLLFVLLLGAVGVAAWMQAKYPLITDLTPRKSLASVFAVFLTIPSLCTFFIPFLSSLILLVLPLEGLWFIEVSIFSSAAVFLLIAYRSHVET